MSADRSLYLDNGPVADPSLTPIVFIPGRFGTAENYVSIEFAGLGPRRCIAVSLRGRGHSDALQEFLGTLDDASALAR